MIGHTSGGCDAACSCQGYGVSVRRRSVLRAAAGGLVAAAGLAGAARAQSTLSPDKALKALMEGNERFIKRKLASCQADLSDLRRETADEQEPFAAVLSCSDSRVPVELIFDQSIGGIFVARVAGNVATAEIIASLEYGAAELGTKTILVLAHSGCGAVKATMAGKPVPGQISTLYRLIRPAVERANGDLATAAQENARIQAGLLRDASPVIGGLVKQGKLSVAAGYYELASGRVSLLS